MGSRFDDAWAAPDAALGVEMGESLTIGGLPIMAVVDESSATMRITGMTVNSGVNFTVFLSAAQVQALEPEKGAYGLQTKEVMRGSFRGRVTSVRDLGGAGAEVGVGPYSSR